MPTAKAGAQSRASVPSPPPQHGGRRGWWGQAKAMGATSHPSHARVHLHRRLRKPPGQIPSQHSLSLRISRYPMAMLFEDLSRWYWVNGNTRTHRESRSRNQIFQQNPQLDFQGNWTGVSARISASVECEC